MAARRKHSYKRSIACLQPSAISGVPLKGKQNSQYSFSCTTVAVKPLNCHCEFVLTSWRTWSLTTGCQVPNSNLLKYMSENMINCCSGQKVFFAVRACEFAKKLTGRGEMKEVEDTAQKKGIYISAAPRRGQLCLSPNVLWNFTCSGRASGVFLE